MISRFDASDRVVTGVLAGVIALVLIGGVVGALTVDSSDSKPAKTEVKAPDAADRQRQAQAAQDAQAIAAANAEALKSITADQDLCKSKYLQAARARAAEATQQLQEQEASLRRILDQLPPGKAKDALGAQLPSEIETSNALIASELRAAEDRCKLAATVYQYTQAEPAPPPPPAG